MPDESAGLIAGKFKDEAALEQSLREGLKATTGVELPASVKVIGEGGLYADVNAAVAGYKGVESALGKLRAPAPPPPKSDDKPLSITPPTPPAAEIDDPAEAVKAAGIDWADIEKAVKECGKPSDEHYAKLKAVGWNKAAVNAYVQGEVAKRQAGAMSYNAVVASLGGKAALQQLIDSAKDNIPADQVDAIESMLKDARTLPVAVQAIKGYAASRPADFVTGSGSTGGSSITTLAQYQEAVLRAARGDQAAKSALETIKASEVWRLK